MTDGVWMVDPAEFDVVYAINPHMSAHVGRVDRALARRQWDELVAVYRRLGLRVEVAPAPPGLPDAVFAANPVAVMSRGLVVLSRMAHRERSAEVDVARRWFASHGWTVVGPPAEPFEGQGDLRAVPGTTTWLCGHGFRTTEAAIAEVAARTGREIAPLRLVDPRLYHLDTALCPLQPGACAWVPSAFDADARDKIAALFPTRIEVPVDEAVDALAANGHCPDHRTLVVDSAATVTRARVAQLGIEVIGVDTSEFRKSGGSVFCLGQPLPG